MARADLEPGHAGDEAPRTGSRPGLIIAALASAGTVVSTMHTLVVPLVPSLPALLHASPSNATWAVTATLLSAAVATPVAGRLGDMYGKRLIMLVSLGFLVAGSVVCALSNSLAPMVTGRTLQGLATGVVPLGISVMRDELPPERLGSALGLMGSSLGIGGALGVPVSAVIAQQADWHAPFWMACGLSAVAIIAIRAIVPESPVREVPGRFDLLGAVGLTVGLLCLLLCISKGSDWGWTQRSTTTTAAFGVVVLLLWARWELRTTNPLVDLRISAGRQVLTTNLASIMIGFAMYGTSLAVPQILQLPTSTGYGLGKSMVVAGLCFAPFGGVMMLASPLTARVTARWGPRTTLMMGAAIIAVGYGLGQILMDSVWQIVLLSSIIGLGVAFAYASMPALIMAAVPETETGSANGLNTLMRALGTSCSAAVIGVVLAGMTTTVAGREVASLAGFRVTFALGAIAALIALVVSAFIPHQRAATASSLPMQREVEVAA